ncbi:siphovirus Gp157 family protein [Ligilactobacillus sp. LYQ139]|uniref:siphovirus Gp157 family protein n=1 Tax=Ligilactobacillus sp. LYQ139 TaxID=3378800 RepID=UPI00385476C8
MNLFELNEKYRELEQQEDLEPEVLKDTLDAINDSREVKLDNIATWIEKNNSQINWLKDKVKELTETKKRLDNKNRSLMNYLTAAIDDAGLKEMQTTNHLLKPRNYRASVVVTNEDQVPDDYLTTRVVTTVDKKAAYAELKAGEMIPGMELKPNRKTTIK